MRPLVAETPPVRAIPVTDDKQHQLATLAPFIVFVIMDAGKPVAASTDFQTAESVLESYPSGDLWEVEVLS